MAIPAYSNHEVESHLTFRKYGPTYYLAQAWIQGTGREFIRSRSEKELVRELSSPKVAQVQVPPDPAAQATK